ncbi:MAG: hypothetical protein AVDCRST_MAG96-2206 [uncultured Segetibacter sp.]|uniref:Uncharacterized protein n=1 Tax=uncultured Segetibacter sp. TaxID=481133 RepID=A0A6J4SUS2_9BACT|nr:MAG: hypothetical protein AVDCRST_MAG96-2206 [uncultured Segetibacter sp.]
MVEILKYSDIPMGGWLRGVIPVMLLYLNNKF